MYYYNFVSENKLLDITDIVTEPLPRTAKPRVSKTNSVKIISRSIR
ncbi:MAG: hypothetical protein ACLUSP_02665 [Christensenellales bacterium]